jgi:hypothetical protein
MYIQRPPVLCDLFSELPSMVAIDKFDCILFASLSISKCCTNKLYKIVAKVMSIVHLFLAQAFVNDWF